MRVGSATLVHADSRQWLRGQAPNAIHAVVTDPPFGLLEYAPKEQAKLRRGRGGVWRLPPAFDGVRRGPVPRFTVLSSANREQLAAYFEDWAAALLPVLVYRFRNNVRHAKERPWSGRPVPLVAAGRYILHVPPPRSGEGRHFARHVVLATNH